MTPEQFAAMLGPTARVTNGVVELQLRDGNFYPFAACVQYIHQEAQDAHNKAWTATPQVLTVKLSGTATPG